MVCPIDFISEPEGKRKVLLLNSRCFRCTSANEVTHRQALVAATQTHLEEHSLLTESISYLVTVSHVGMLSLVAL
jgi:hypothetical protein